MKTGKHMLGRRLSAETKLKISASQIRIGNKPPSSVGRIFSEETRAKIGLSNKKAFLEGRKSVKGDKNPSWKGGKKPLVLTIRHCLEYRLWRSDCMTRDDFTCQLCGIRGGNLEVDHFPKKFSTIFWENKIESLIEAIGCSEFWNLNNGRTLCRACHDKTKKK